MSALSSLLDKVTRAYARIAEVEAVAAQFPRDIYVLGNLSSLRRDAAKLEDLWEEESLRAQLEVCRYRIVPQIDEDYAIRNVGQSLISFQNLFSQIFDAVTMGKKMQRKFSEEVATLTALNFGFAYPGSLGVAMTVPADRDLFTSRYDKIIDEILIAMRLHSENEVRQIAEQYGLAVVRRLYDWSLTNSSSGYGIGVNWKTTLGETKSRTVDAADFARNADLISRVSEATTDRLSVSGTLLGIDGSTKFFRLVTDDNKVIAGRLSDAFPAEVKWAINTRYDAKIDEQTVTQFATDETKVTYRLVELDKPIENDLNA